MNRVTRRVWIVVLFLLILVGGMGFFLAEYAAKADQWVSFKGSPHVYSQSNLGTGMVYDRDGVLLMDTSGSRCYAEDVTLRKATVHWLGDRQGNINAGALAGYAGAMAGFDRINGIYASEDIPGKATLTLSAQVQITAMEALAGRNGTVAVYNYKTGEILCAVTSPNYDPEDPPVITAENESRYEGIYLNRFLQSSYTPGSIFKLVTTAAALDCVEGIEEMTFTCTGTYEYAIGSDVSCERAHGTNTLKMALANSCNCAFAQIVELVGKENMTQYVEKLGIMDSVSFDGISTAKGNYDVSEAIPVELAWSGIGQYTDLINPCAFLQYMGAIGGNGVAARPYLVESVRVGDTVTYEAKTYMEDRILSVTVADTLEDYMRNNVQMVYGDWYFPGLNVCAKSGTSQQGGEKASNAMFAGFVADEEYPLAFIVVVEGGGYGSSTCVPILSRVLDACKQVYDGR